MQDVRVAKGPWFGWTASIELLPAGLLDRRAVRIPGAFTVRRDHKDRWTCDFAVVEESRGISGRGKLQPRYVDCATLGWRPSRGTVQFEFSAWTDFLEDWRFSVRAPAAARDVLKATDPPESFVLDALLAAAASELQPQPTPAGPEVLPGWILTEWTPGSVFRSCTETSAAPVGDTA